MQKIINKHKHDKKNKKPHHKDIPDSLDGEIILSVDSKGISSWPEEALDYLLLDESELEKTGAGKWKAKFIEDGTITQSDIDKEKIKPEVAGRLVALNNKIKLGE